MKNLFLAGMFSIVLVFGLTVVGCDSGGGGGGGGGGGSGESGGGSNGKTLVITNISGEQAAAAIANGIQIGIFPTGTTPAQAHGRTTIIAGAEDDGITLSGSSAPFTATAPLWAGPLFTNRWTGSGTYDIYLILWVPYATYYRKQNVSFTSATTSVNASTFEVVDM